MIPLFSGDQQQIRSVKNKPKNGLVMECHLLHLSNGLSSFSPNGLHVALALSKKLAIYVTSDLENIYQTFQCLEVIRVFLINIMFTTLIILI